MYSVSLLIYLLGAGWLVPFVSVDDCELLPNGTYKMIQYSSSQKIEAEIEIGNGHFIQKGIAGSSTKKKLVWIYECMFTVEDTITHKEELTGLDSLLSKSFGAPCYQLQGKNGDTTVFRTTYTGNLRVTSSSGMFIRMK